MNGKQAPFISALTNVALLSTEQEEDIIPPRTARIYALWMVYDWLKRGIPSMFSHPKTRNNESSAARCIAKCL